MALCFVHAVAVEAVGFGYPPIFSGVGGHLPGPTVVGEHVELHNDDEQHEDDDLSMNVFLCFVLLLGLRFDVTIRSAIGTSTGRS